MVIDRRSEILRHFGGLDDRKLCRILHDFDNLFDDLYGNFDDLDFYERYERSITGERCRKLDHGPAPFDFNTSLKRLSSSDADPDMSVFTEDERTMIDWVFSRLGHLTASQISGLSHDDAPRRLAEDRGEISYEAVFCRIPQSSVLEFA